MFNEHRLRTSRAQAEEGAGLRNDSLWEWRGSSSNSAYMLLS